ncbi:uncharacterized protein percc1 [Polymixia lowei]
MATGVIRNFLFQTPAPCYFPVILQHRPSKEEVKEKVEEMEEDTGDRDDEEEREEEGEEEDEEDGGSEVQEEDEECLEEVALQTFDVTKQLLRFADVISRDVQRYFGRGTDDQDACDIYNDSVPVTTSGRLRYYDDLLRIARTGNPEDQDAASVTRGNDQGVRVAACNSGLGPLAELFDQRGQSQGRGRPMIKRHLPLSFWTEPIPCCSLLALGDGPDDAQTDDETLSRGCANTNAHMHYSPHPHGNANALDNAHPDFSDLLAHWDPNPELTHTLTESAHTHPEQN